MKRSALARSTKPMTRSPMAPSTVPMTRSPMTRHVPLAPGAKAGVLPCDAPKPKRMKSRQRAVTPAEKLYWDRLATIVGCIACRHDGHFNPVVSIHHIDGRTKLGCHQLVLPLCAGHHQQGTGNDPTLIARHPTKALFVERYGPELELKAHCDAILAGEAA